MCERLPILENPQASAERDAMKIVALDRSKRPEALMKVEQDLYVAAMAEDRTEGEATFFAHEMRRLIEEAIGRIAERGRGKGVRM
jgi:hypothetical protein